MIILLSNIILILIEAIAINILITPSKQAKKLYCYLAFLQLFILHAFLNPYNMEDLPSYIETFDLFGSNNIEYSIITGFVGIKMEFGWIIICHLLYYISKNYLILLLFTSFIIVGGYIKTIYKFSPYAWLSVFLFLCTTYDQSLFVLRQHTAMALCLLSVTSIINRRFKSFISLILIAFSIHSTAIIFIPTYFLYSHRCDRKFFYILIFLILLISIFSNLIFNWFFSNTWYDSYSDKEGSNYTTPLISLCSLLVFLFSINFKTSNLQDSEKCFFIMALMAVVISFVGVGFSPTNRLSKYYSISSIIIIPLAIKKLKSHHLKVTLSSLIITLYLILFFSPNNTIYIQNYELQI